MKEETHGKNTGKTLQNDKQKYHPLNEILSASAY